jgi:aminoglycoside N3'-acetyltransferase
MQSKKQITNNFKKIKIKESFIIIHSDITGLIFKNFSLEKLWNIIREGLGKNKTYIFPTFTFSNKHKTWSYKKSKSESGALSEYFRKNIATRRTVHPIHSVAIYGKNQSKVPSHNSKSSFGKRSTWEWLCKSKDVCNLAIGLNLHGGGTFCHYSEEKHKINYRKFKILKLKIIGKNNKLIKKKFTYFSRKAKIKNDWSACERDLINEKLIKRIKFKENDYPIIKMNTYKVTNFILKKIERDKYYLTNKNLSS